MNVKDEQDKTKNRIVTYLNDEDFYKFNLLVGDRGLKPGKYLRLLVLAHIKDLESNGQLVVNTEVEEDV